MKKIHKPMNKTRNASDSMGVAEQTSNGGSNKPTFSPITQAIPEIWPKRWTE